MTRLSHFPFPILSPFPSPLLPPLVSSSLPSAIPNHPFRYRNIDPGREREASRKGGRRNRAEGRDAEGKKGGGGKVGGRWKGDDEREKGRGGREGGDKMMREGERDSLAHKRRGHIDFYLYQPF